jgi:hypothetical protein
MSYHTYNAAHCPVLSCPTLCPALLLLLLFFTLLLLLLLSTISLLFLLFFILFSLSQPLLSLRMHILNSSYILPQQTLLVTPAYHTTHPHCPSALSTSPPPPSPSPSTTSSPHSTSLSPPFFPLLSPSHFPPSYPPLFSPMCSSSPSFRQLYSLQKLSHNFSLRCLTTVSISSHIKS